jgi:predicted DCC family thiol-disulfide oxidoreductase YuxK
MTQRKENAVIAEPRFPLTIYYDASCPLCRSEMETLKSRDADDALRLVDCAAPAFDPRPAAAEGITLPMMMSRIHARDAAGRWFRGMDVFAAAYRAAGFRGLARLYQSPRLRPLFDRIYPWIADNRNRLSRLGLHRLFHWFVPEVRYCDRRNSSREPTN